MKKIVRLTESELKNIVEASVKRTINEGPITEEMLNEGIKEKAVELAKIAGVSVAVAAGWLTALGFGAFDQQGKTIDDNSRAFQVDREEYGDALNPANQNNDTTAMNKFGAYEERIKGAVMESIMNLMNEGKPADTQIGRHKFKAIRRDKNGNLIYTHEGGTLSDNDLKAQGWKYSKKHGLHGQISDPTKLPK